MSINKVTNKLDLMYLFSFRALLMFIFPIVDMKGVTHYRSELETKANESYFNMEQLLDMVSRYKF